MKKYSSEHEWISTDGDILSVGITDYAQHQLGDVVYISYTVDENESVSAGDAVAEIESVKSVSQIFTPVSGVVTAFNSAFEDESKVELVNKDPYGAGWIFKIKVKDRSELDSLMTEDQYNKYISEL